MNKANKQCDKKIVKALTRICESAKFELEGFVWLTHTVNYTDFPNSLIVYCVFDTQEHVTAARAGGQSKVLSSRINQGLEEIGVLSAQVTVKVVFDSEQAGAAKRLLGE